MIDNDGCGGNEAWGIRLHVDRYGYCSCNQENEFLQIYHMITKSANGMCRSMLSSKNVTFVEQCRLVTHTNLYLLRRFV